MSSINGGAKMDIVKKDRYQVVKFSNGKFGVIDNVDTGFETNHSFASYSKFMGLDGFSETTNSECIADTCMTDSRATADLLCKNSNTRDIDIKAATSFERL